MTSATVDAEHLTIELTTAEHVLALHGDVRIPRAAITGVEVVPDGYAAAHGLRAPGLGIPGHRVLGTLWSPGGGREFVDVHGGQPAVRVTLRDQPWTAVLIGGDDAEDLAARLRAAA